VRSRRAGSVLGVKNQGLSSTPDSPGAPGRTVISCWVSFSHVTKDYVKQWFTPPDFEIWGERARVRDLFAGIRAVGRRGGRIVQPDKLHAPVGQLDLSDWIKTIQSHRTGQTSLT